jgi:hypothetical protein
MLLLNYFHYLLDIFPCYRGAIIYKTARDAKILAMRHRYRCHTAGMRYPNSLRGATFHIALVIHPSRKKLREILTNGSKWVFFCEKNAHLLFYRSKWVLKSLYITEYHYLYPF